ncbi:vWA domain-containing protein [Streptomyces roseifaciens]|uniref:vWA domain-containing protein n=1 Tax=Streptomyces roseifaciens TaxID=1488406 RepID=UPI00099F6386|nr:VWA domain-containing protein [Streptomyces roseifaciens]
MGIRSLLRNAFGRSRTATAERDDASLPQQSAPPSVPAPSQEPEPRAASGEARTESRDPSLTESRPDPVVARPRVSAEKTAPAEETVPAAASATAPEPAAATEPKVTEPRAAEPAGDPAAEPAAAEPLRAPVPPQQADDAARTTDPAGDPVAEPAAAEPFRAPVPPQQGGGGRIVEPVGEPDGGTIPDPGPLEPHVPPRPGPTPGPRPGPGPIPPEPSPEPEPQPTPVPTPKPIPEPEPVPPVDPEPVPEPAPGPDPVRKPEPAPGPVPEPAPAFPPRDEAPAETVSGQAVSAPAVSAPTVPAQTAPAQAVPPQTVPAQGTPAQNTPAQSPAISLTKVEKSAPGLVSLYKAAGVSLEKQGLTGQRAAVYLVLDRSGSMREFYRNGTVQHLAEQALGLSANLDDDGTVPVVFFSTDVDGVAEIDLGNYEGRIGELHSSMGHMGRTNYHWAMEAVIEHYKNSGSTAPAFVIFQTDGGPYSKPAAERALCESANLPIFWQFVAFGDPEGKGFDFLRKLDDLPVPEKRVVDNAGFFHAGRDPKSLTAAQLYAELMVEFPDWLKEARAAGIVKD